MLAVDYMQNKKCNTLRYLIILFFITEIFNKSHLTLTVDYIQNKRCNTLRYLIILFFITEKCNVSHLTNV